MVFDRSKFKAAKLESNKAVSREISEVFKKDQRVFGDYHTIDKGVNYFRILPPHPNTNDDPSFQPKAVYWLECLVEKKDEDGKGTGKYERARRPIFDSRIHGGTAKDIVDEYIKLSRKIVFDTYQDKDEAKKKLYPITGYRGKDKKWNPGILCSQSFVCYATKNGITPENIGRLELFQGDKEKLEELNIAEGEGEPITTDIFSDPVDGVEFILRLTTDENGKTVRIISKREMPPIPRGLTGKSLEKHIQGWQDSQIVSDEVLEKFESMEPLVTMFKGAYKRPDFEKALEALTFLDEKMELNLFQNDEWLDIVNEIDAYYPEKDNVLKNQNKEFPLEEMTRAELKEYIVEHNLPIKVKSIWTENQIVDAIKEAQAVDDEEEEEGGEPAHEGDIHDEEEGGEPETYAKPLSLREQALARIRSKKK